MQKVENRRVSDEESCSDHRHIRFDITRLQKERITHRTPGKLTGYLSKLINNNNIKDRYGLKVAGEQLKEAILTQKGTYPARSGRTKIFPQRGKHYASNLMGRELQERIQGSVDCVQQGHSEGQKKYLKKALVPDSNAYLQKIIEKPLQHWKFQNVATQRQGVKQWQGFTSKGLLLVRMKTEIAQLRQNLLTGKPELIEQFQTA